MVKYFRFRRLKCSAHNIFVFIVCWCIVLYSQGCVCFYPRFSRKRHLPVQKWQRLCRYGYSEVRNDTQKWGGFKGSNILFILFFWVLKYKIEAAEKKNGQPMSSFWYILCNISKKMSNGLNDPWKCLRI